MKGRRQIAVALSLSSSCLASFEEALSRSKASALFRHGLLKNQRKKNMASRVLWKGAISFGLVHIPVALHSATSDNGIDFDWLDKRSMDPVGYKRINKKTGKEIDRENIVKGIAYEEGQYVILTDEEITAAYPGTTQTIEIESFVANTDIPFVYLERPYYIAPINKGQKVYALLRDTLLQTQRVGIARVVIQTKQHLAVLVPSGPGLVLNLLRWGADIRPWDELTLPPEGSKAAGLSERELAMARQLVDDMTDRWDPARFTDSFKDDIMALVKRKVKEGKTETVRQPEDAGESAGDRSGAQILDLTELLQRSLRRGGAPANAPANTPANTETTERRARKTKTAPAKAAKAPAKTAARKAAVRRAA
jgi:DNA end-binding protein Ku